MYAQEDKDLLLRDLCVRLPYGVKLHIRFYDTENDDKLKERDITLCDGYIDFIIMDSHWVECKPYLRRMSSMTNEERKEYDNMFYNDRERQITWTRFNLRISVMMS